MKKRLVALTLTCALAATALAGCGGSTGGDSTASGDSTAATETSTAATETSTAEGSVYYLNFKPEQAQQTPRLTVQQLRALQLRPQHLMQKALFIT